MPSPASNEFAHSEVTLLRETLEQGMAPGAYDVVHRKLYFLMSHEAAILLSYLWNVARMNRAEQRGGGWFYCTADRLARDLNLSPQAQTRLLSELKGEPNSMERYRRRKDGRPDTAHRTAWIRVKQCGFPKRRRHVWIDYRLIAERMRTVRLGDEVDEPPHGGNEDPLNSHQGYESTRDDRTRTADFRNKPEVFRNKPEVPENQTFSVREYTQISREVPENTPSCVHESTEKHDTCEQRSTGTSDDAHHKQHTRSHYKQRAVRVTIDAHGGVDCDAPIDKDNSPHTRNHKEEAPLPAGKPAGSSAPPPSTQQPPDAARPGGGVNSASGASGTTDRKNTAHKKEVDKPTHGRKTIYRGTAIGAAAGAPGLLGGDQTTTNGKRQRRPALRLYEELTRLGKVRNDTKARGWDHEFAELLKSLNGNSARLEAVLSWYLRHIDGDYVPVAYSAWAFRTKFAAIEEAMRRHRRQEEREAGRDGDDYYRRQRRDAERRDAERAAGGPAKPKKPKPRQYYWPGEELPPLPERTPEETERIFAFLRGY